MSLSGMESNSCEKVNRSVRSLDVEHHLDETNEDLQDSLIGCSPRCAGPEQKLVSTAGLEVLNELYSAKPAQRSRHTGPPGYVGWTRFQFQPM
jgi:hypothetical protein